MKQPMIDLTTRELMIRYVRDRVARECKGAFGMASHIARSIGVVPASICDIETRPVGDKLLHGLAAFWGLTYGELESIALRHYGVTEAPKSFQETHPNLRSTIDWLRGQDYPDAYLSEYDVRARKYFDDRPKSEWFYDIRGSFFEWKQRHGELDSEPTRTPPRERHRRIRSEVVVKAHATSSQAKPKKVAAARSGKGRI